MESSSQPTAPPSSPSKMQKFSLQEAVVENDGVDRISDLPDSLLCHMLSFLPTTKAVATSILSSRWKTLWTFVPCLYLEMPPSLIDHWNRQKDFYIFPYIVSRIFTQHKASYLQKFRVVAGLSSYAPFVHTWVCAALSPKLEELDLNIFFERLSEHYSEQRFELPRSLFSCKKIMVLKLNGGIILNLPSSFCFPSLKILYLSLSAYNGDSDWKLISGCPVLEDLVIIRTEGSLRIGEGFDEVIKFKICVPTLKRLVIVFRIFRHKRPDYKLEISTPALEYFKFRGDLREVVFLEKLPNLVEANVGICAFEDLNFGSRNDYGDLVYYAKKLLGLLRELYNVKFLSLSEGSIECLSLASDYELPMFHNLARLNYEFSCCNWHVIRYLLKQAPNLEVLDVQKKFLPSEAHPPVCVKQHLNAPHLGTFYFREFEGLRLSTFYFREFQGLEDELKFVRCILKKASVLKKMTFRYWGSHKNAVEEKSRILDKVSNFPRRSISCQFAFERGLFEL